VPYLPHTRPDHDEALIAQLAMDDLDLRQATDARRLVAECPACAELLEDLRLIASATAALPASSRTRDFRLTEADAARLRPGGWRGLVARFGTPGFAFTKPLATGLATLGIAGLVLAALPGSIGGSATSAPEGAFSTVAGPVQAQDAGVAPGVGAAPPKAGPEVASSAKAGASQVPANGGAAVTAPGSGSRDGSPSPAAAAAAAPTNPAASTNVDRASLAQESAEPHPGPTPLTALSVTLLLVGLALFGLRLLATRIV
jgi:hypothetical protein